MTCCDVDPRFSPDIIETELLGQKELLREGLLSYRPNTAQTLQQFQKGKEVGESWKDFVIKLAGLVRIDEVTSCPAVSVTDSPSCTQVQSWELLCNYLSTEYRGTSDSLAALLKVGDTLHIVHCTLQCTLQTAPPRKKPRPGRCFWTSGSSTGLRGFTSCRYSYCRLYLLQAAGTLTADCTVDSMSSVLVHCADC